ncbi:MAG: type II toxin-antitoxin system PemK/MazF family toxin [Lachnospiraceae bacterium]|nr:type II toxin-antitoxin system PemK/MazF family toxin [Lachnospiraceae bacterium]MBR1848004.1 type II toxin-antitoxin system PemK/MazF family toxin [Lachnospiraceae bacterium]
MTNFFQGDIIKIAGFDKRKFVIISKNAFIRATGVFHVCPLLKEKNDGPLHIIVLDNETNTTGTAICEQVKLIDPAARACSKIGRIRYDDIMEVSDAIQGMFEYD